MGNWTVYYNEKCSKCRGVMDILRGKGISPTVVEYLATPPDRATLEGLVAKLGLPPRAIARTKEPKFLELGIDADDGDAVLGALARYPELLERPIVVRGDRAVLGRPPENVLQLLG